MDEVGNVAVGHGVFDVGTMNEFVARTRSVPRALFGDLWVEGELAVMFGEAGCGKSVLAVQIADSIARGTRLKPMHAAPRRQKVVYVDLESLAGQFCRRYMHDDEGRGFRPHRFSANLIHAGVVSGATADIAAIGELAKGAGARVLVIDNIAHLMKNRSSSEAARVMGELRRLTRVEGISILLLAHSAPGNLRRGIEACDMPFAAVMTGMADNVFAVGRTGSDPAGRYIKHIKPGSSALTFGAAHVPSFRIRKRANYTYFEFRGMAREGALRLSDNDRREWRLIDRIGELKRSGMSVRDIGRAIEMSKSSVQRYLTMIESDTSLAPPQEARPQPAVSAWGEEDDGSEMDEDDDEGFELPELEEDDDLAEDDEAPWKTAEIQADSEPADVGSDDHPLLERDLDRYGNEIFVEKRDYTGRRLIWYGAQTNGRKPNGKYTKFVYIPGIGISGETVESLPGEVRGP